VGLQAGYEESSSRIKPSTPTPEVRKLSYYYLLEERQDLEEDSEALYRDRDRTKETERRKNENHDLYEPFFSRKEEHLFFFDPSVFFLISLRNFEPFTPFYLRHKAIANHHNLSVYIIPKPVRQQHFFPATTYYHPPHHPDPARYPQFFFLPDEEDPTQGNTGLTFSAFRSSKNALPSGVSVFFFSFVPCSRLRVKKVLRRPLA
jgi:hypothetical protein